ncbi:MAG: helix-turn-helix transcriptional regulator [Nitrosopumilus sp.]|nr:helix-turn-helix transcriptional regulator [Nitrosopumilus sp.]
MEFIIEKRKQAGKGSLTKREKEILGYLIDGYTVPEIAGMLNRSKETIKTHRHNIY